MADKHEMEASGNPLATIDDIQKRLTRPHLYENSLESKSNSKTSLLQKRRKLLLTENLRLEDYFDLTLLSTIRAKMKSSLKKKGEVTMNAKSEFEEFVWPIGDDDDDSDNVFVESNRRIFTNEAIVDLKNDDDSIGIGIGNGEENQVCCLDLFQRFESTALMQFKR